jgi:hypothetical protein
MGGCPASEEAIQSSRACSKKIEGKYLVLLMNAYSPEFRWNRRQFREGTQARAARS